MPAAAPLDLEQTPLTAADRPGQTIVLPGQTPKGEHILGVLVKRTFSIVSGKACQRADRDRKLVPADSHFDDPMNTSVQFESDFVPFKLATDVVVNGKAYAPGGRAVQKMTASLVVGTARKDIVVFGDRVCRYKDRGDPVFTEPTPFASMELRYERAYGGVDVWSEPNIPYPYPRNHLGRGFVVANTRQGVDSLPLPNLEDPHDLLTPARLCVKSYQNWERQPTPQNFGWSSKYSHPRAALAGVMPADRALEQQMRGLYAQVMPEPLRKEYLEQRLPDMDFRFFNGASAGLVFPYLTGNEWIRTVNLTAEGEQSFQLPGDRVRIGLDIGQGMQEPAVVLHTVAIRLEERQIDLVWRGAVSYPGPDWLPEMKKSELRVQ